MRDAARFLKKFFSRKFIALAGSYVVSSYALSRGVEISPSEVQGVAQAVAAGGNLKEVFIIGFQAWVTKWYVTSQGAVDQELAKEELSAMKTLILGDDEHMIRE